MHHLTTPARTLELAATLARAACAATPAQPQYLASWLPSLCDEAFDLVERMAGSNGQGPVLEGMTDTQRRALLRSIASRLTHAKRAPLAASRLRFAQWLRNAPPKASGKFASAFRAANRGAA